MIGRGRDRAERPRPTTHDTRLRRRTFTDAADTTDYGTDAAGPSIPLRIFHPSPPTTETPCSRILQLAGLEKNEFLQQQLEGRH